MTERKPPPLLVAATIEVLRRHAPFDAMEDSDLAELAGRLRLRYFAKGAVILSPASGTVNTLFIIQRGAVKAEDPSATALDHAVFSLAPGECFPVGALIGRRPTTLRYAACIDTFCYVLEEPSFQVLMGRSREFHAFCTRRLAHLLEQSRQGIRQTYAGRASNELTMASPLRAALRRSPVTLASTTIIRAVLELMKAKRIGSVVLTGPDGAPEGIFTQTDVLDRVALAGMDLARPVADVMTRDPVTLPATSPAAEAAHLMARHGFRHVVVMDGDRLAGVISERDLFSLQRLSMQGLRKEIRQADGTEALAFVARDVRALAAAMLAQGIAAEQLTQFVTALNDALVVRALELAGERHEVGGLGFCWIGLGSEGRMEQTLATDQDNAIIIPDEVEGGVAAAKQRLLAFAGDVNVTLDACGFPLCKGDIMARNPQWCLGLVEWKDRFDDWMRNAHPEALLNAAIFFDFRALAGDAALAEKLRAFLLGKVKDRPAFLRQMAVNALQVRSPLGLLGEIAVDESAGGTLDLKLHGSRPFVDVARILALANGVGATATADRLRQAGSRARMSPDEIDTALDAFHFIQMLRLRNQDAIDKGAGGGAGPNRIDPGTLNSLDRRILKESLRQARKLQSRIALDYQL